MNKIICTVFFMSLNIWVLAQSNIMNTDRPNVAFSPSTLDGGDVQIQTGVYTGQSTVSIWEAAPRTTGWGLDLRIGISDRFEVNGYYADQFIDVNRDDQRRFGLGLRYELASFDKFSLTAIGMLQRIEFKDVNDLMRTAPQFNLSGAYSFSDQSSVGFDLGSDWYASDGTPALNYALYLTRSLGESAFGFIENYGRMYRGLFNTYFDAGVGFQISSQFLLDLNGGIASNNGLTEYRIGMGATWRIAKGKSE